MAEISNRKTHVKVITTPYRLPKTGNKILKWDQLTPGNRFRNILKCSTPSYPSPIDRIRCGKNKRAEDLGWTGWRNSSFEGNQSFPLCSKPKLRKDEIDPDTPPVISRMERIRGDGLNTCSFSAGRTRGSFSMSRIPETSSIKVTQGSHDQGSNIKALQGISDSAWSFSSSFMSAVGGASTSYPITAMNPNKAVFTIDIKSSQVLVVNGKACHMLGFLPDELCQMKLTQLLNGRHKMHITALAEEQLDTKEGNMVILSGKVVEMLTKDLKVVPVSLWLRKLETDGRCLAVAEPVERRVANIVIDAYGCISSADTETAIIFQYDEQELEGFDIMTLIPSIKLPGSDDVLTKDIMKQKATGRTREGATFPLCLCMSEDSIEDKEIENANSKYYNIVIWVFANMSGLVVLNEDGIIESCNHHFTHMMFGYPQSELIGLKITSIIPNFCDDLEYLGSIPLELAKCTEDDHSNYDSAVEHIDHDKSCGSSVTAESEYSSSKDFNSRKDKNVLKSLIDGTNQRQENKDITNGNNCFEGCDQIVDSLNKLNIGFNRELYSADFSPCSSNNSPLNASPKKVSAFTVSHSAPVINSRTSDVLKKSKIVPPSSLNIQIKDGDGLLDMENNSDNGELTPIVSPHTDFIEEEENFETASDEDESIEVIKNDHDIDPNNEHSETPHLLTSKKFENLSPKLQAPKDFIANSLQNLMDTVNLDSVSNGEYFEEGKCSGLIRNVNVDCEDLPLNSNIFDPSDRTIEILTSTPAANSKILKRLISKDYENKENGDRKYADGNYFGFGRHKDNSNLDIVYRVRAIALSSGRIVYCVWVSRDPEEVGEGGRNCSNLTLTSSFNSTVDNSLGQAIRSCAQSNVPLAGNRSGSISVLSQCEDDQICGEYGEHYTTLQQIGKGAYGYVKMAFRNEDGLLVITKFIQKHKVHQQSWVDDPNLGRKVPLEISLLTTLQHPNIVHVLDVFENPKFFQLVMEKHGAGMDLFEFIDRKPYLDETLNSYIFRQIVSAIDYLHSLQILHRDIKDENVIINERFVAKLIDFGSATFMSEGRLFSTFYGTVEYCSPEVLAGNKYEGPALEVWSLGVTLYVMTFGENPFFDIEEIMKAELHPPSKVSDELMQLLHWMLHNDPQKRCKVKELVEHPWINKEVDISGYNFQDVVSCHPQEAHPPVYYSDYRCDSANDSLSNRFPATESSSALRSNHDEDSNADDRTVGSSNSLGSLTTVENFETEEDLIASAADSKLSKIEESCVEECEPRQSSVTVVGKETHSFEEELVDLTCNVLTIDSDIVDTNSGIVDVEDSWDPDFYEEEDSFS